MSSHIKGLDGIRCLAVSSVLVAHFFVASESIRNFHLGHFGVMAFFVLSGFLITRIILNQKNQGIRISVFLKNFYIRRALRIFPLFYLAIVSFSCFGDGYGASLPWHLGYASNFLYATVGPTFLGSHFWSLAVEEQFYLLFPIFIFLMPKNRESIAIILLLCIGLFFRIYHWNLSPSRNDMLLHGNLDALALGALLAHALTNNQNIRNFIWCFIGIAFTAISSFVFLSTITGVHFTLLLLFTFIIWLISMRQSSFAVKILDWKPIRYVGTISYGLYVWHQLIWYNIDLAEPLISWLDTFHPIMKYGHSKRLCAITASFCLSISSWHLFEYPILKLKSRFIYG